MEVNEVSQHLLLTHPALNAVEHVPRERKLMAIRAIRVIRDIRVIRVVRVFRVI